ncbi:alpha/beta fold hydrolase [Hyphococcus sp.]|uniref:alpha/beta fold hydrolase n=1 Tax=Hyphococcus sp. TaxID=2038636 RepID=UPI0035C7384C
MNDRAALPPVLLAHGWGGSFDATYGAAFWHDIFADAGLSVAGLDLPGHGRRPASHDAADYGDLAGAAEKDIRDDIEDAVGFSLGSKLLLELECRKPGRFRRLVLGGVGANVFAPERGVEAVADVLESGAVDDAPEPVKMMIRYAAPSRSDPLALAAVLRRAPNPQFTRERLARVKAKILFINGENDKGVAPVTELADCIPGCASMTLSKTGHIDLPDDPRFAEAAAAFLSENINAKQK